MQRADPPRALPIDPVLPELLAALRSRPRLILRAPPGAGKTTRVPAALLDAGLAGDRRVVVLEPRRIAARAAAEFVARERGRTVGGEVGYRVRFEQRGSAATRLWFVTEGVFGRQLVADPFIEEAGVVVLDEFHERHLQGDVALAVVRHLQETVRPDLRLVVMSATLDTDALGRALGDAAVVTAEGRAHPVEIEYDDKGPKAAPLAVRVAGALRRVLDTPGDVLVFLPGAADIRRAAEAIGPLATARGFDVVPLHGDLPLEAQERALRAGPRRRVVLATNVAETSLTVEGVTAVIDGGVARIARFDARHGINGIRVQAVSRAAAEQRAGRAGRVAPGRCIRLWSRAEHAARRAHETPEILRLDLGRTVLELRAWGLAGADELGWIDPPPAGALGRADRLLGLLGALGPDGRMTPIGRRMLELPAEPRLARLLVEAERSGCPGDGALLAALVSERDVLAGARAFGAATRDFPPGPSDVLLRAELVEDAVRRGGGRDACAALGLEPRAVHAVERARRQLARLLSNPRGGGADTAALLRATLAGFPDRVARRRAPRSPRAVMVGGAGLVLTEESVVREAELFVALDLERGAGPDARVRIASAIEAAWLEELFPGAVRETSELVFDREHGRVVARLRRLYQDLVLAEQVRTDVDPLAAGEILAEVLRADPTPLLDDPARELIARLGFLAQMMPEVGWPAALEALVGDAAASLAAGRRTIAELRGAELADAIRGLLSPAQRRALSEAPPDHRLPGGRTAKVRYAAGRAPTVAARIQEVFGLAATPRVAGGRVPLVFELLAPNQRPVQVTDDLASFWRTTYAEVRRQLRGRYPKHDWPEVHSPPSRTRGRDGVDRPLGIAQAAGVRAGQRLLLLSHRPPFEVRRTPGGARVAQQMGGLAAAIDRVVLAADGTWEAWAAFAPGADGGVSVPLMRAVRLRDAGMFHGGFGNQVLWPLCHIFPNRCDFHPALWTVYRRANESFAAAVRDAAEPADVIWVNDFHLALVPGFLRAAGVAGRVGMFWHIPFPPPSVFGICPWRTDVLGGLLGADLIGFQTDADAHNFLDCVRQFLGLRVVENPPGVVLPERTVRVVALPVGVDADRLRDEGADPGIRAQAERLRATLGVEAVVLGVDRLDYAKGINERLRGFERFLERHSEWRRRVALVQITVPSQFHMPDFHDLKHTIEESVGRILGRFTYDGRGPLSYLYTAFDHERLAVYYAAADIALVTPLRDGMSLVAKEYVACQTGAEGILVLSEFSGAAEELSEALLVNPYDPEAIRRQLHAAVTMPPPERRRRMRALASKVAGRSVAWWTSSFLGLLSDG